MGAGETETDLFGRVGPAVAARGFYKKSEMARVVEWKTRRVRSRFARNPASDVEDVTRIALRAPEHLQHRILCLLKGVGEPVASAVLTVCAPDRHTVLDFRAVEALERLSALGQLLEKLPTHARDSLPDYLDTWDAAGHSRLASVSVFVTWTAHSGCGAASACLIPRRQGDRPRALWVGHRFRGGERAAPSTGDGWHLDGGGGPSAPAAPFHCLSPRQEAGPRVAPSSGCSESLSLRRDLSDAAGQTPRLPA
jgi:hypothetical protein